MTEASLNALARQQRVLFERVFDLSGEQKQGLEALLAALNDALRAGHTALALTSAQQALLESLPAGLVDEAGEAPLVRMDGLLTYQRMWQVEKRLAQAVAARFAPVAWPDGRPDGFGSTELAGEKWAAIEQALTRRFFIISGGPGTGKTTTLAWLLATLLHGQPALNIALAAPTGKAAQRMSEALADGAEKLPGTLATRLPTEASTLHRLLECHRVLPWDVVVVDEASMVDVQLMQRLMEALLPHARLYLLGDEEQLASVEAGSVLADLLAVEVQLGVRLRETFRYDGPIADLAEAVRTGRAEEAVALLRAGKPKLVWQPALSPSRLVAQLSEGYADYLDALRVGPAQALAALGRFRALSPLRRGPLGVERLNERLLLHWMAQGLVRPVGEGYCHGQAVMITENTPSLALYNGDVGIVWQKGDQAQVHFANGVILPLAQLPVHETAFVMTVHKAQGAEFEHTLLILPDEDTPLLARQLVYTALTRAKEKFTLVGSENSLKTAISRKIQRFSTLLPHLRRTLSRDPSKFQGDPLQRG